MEGARVRLAGVGRSGGRSWGEPSGGEASCRGVGQRGCVRRQNAGLGCAGVCVACRRAVRVSWLRLAYCALLVSAVRKRGLVGTAVTLDAIAEPVRRLVWSGCVVPDGCRRMRWCCVWMGGSGARDGGRAGAGSWCTGKLGGREWDERREGEGELRWGAPAWACGGLGCGSELCGCACGVPTGGACEQGVVRVACVVGECGART